MKKNLLLLLLLAPFLCISQEVSEENSLNYYGEKVSLKSLADLSQIDEGSLIKVQGTVLSSCPKKGCNDVANKTTFITNDLRNFK